MSENLISKTLGKKISRRSFLKWTSAIGATSTLSGLVIDQAAKMAAATSHAHAPNTAGSIVDWVPTTCLVCHSWCRIAVGIDANSVVRKIEGVGGQPRTNAFNQGWSAQAGDTFTGDFGGANNPALQGNNVEDDTFNRYCQTGVGQLAYSALNRGRICAKGNDGMEHLYDPDRVKYPLLRIGPRGSGKWRKITWSQLYAGDSSLTVDDGLGGRVQWHGIAGVLRDLGASATALNYTVNGGTNNGGSYYGDVSAKSGSAPDRRHRFAVYVGRNESDQTGNGNFGKLFTRFVDSYGTKNYVEHTNLCESSRHGAQLWQQKEKFPMADIFIKNPAAPMIMPKVSGGTDNQMKGGGQKNYKLSEKDNPDFFVSWGGNVVEASIPHTALAQRVADIRRIGGRIIAIDVRQSNTMAFADEYKYVVPGTDGAVAAAVIHQMMAFYGDPAGAFGGLGTYKTRLDLRNKPGAVGASGIGTNGNNWVRGVFNAETAMSGYASKSLESYVRQISGAPNPDGGGAKNPAWAVGICNGTGAASGTGNMTENDIKYLAWAATGGFGYGVVSAGGGTASSGNVSGTSLYTTVSGLGLLGAQPPRNPIFDGYRGPSKHSNGTYNYMLLRALQTIACGFDDGTGSVSGQPSEAAKRSGGVNRPGGLCHFAWGQLDSWAVDPQDTGGRRFRERTIKNSASQIDWRGSAPSPDKRSDGNATFSGWTTASNLGSWPVVSGTGLTTLGNSAAEQRIDNWDYHGQGGSKWIAATHKTYSNFIPGVRASVGLHPYKEGVLNTVANVNPYGLNGWDANFKTEVFFNHKSNAGYSTPGSAADRDLFTATGTSGYLLKHHWSCDINFGDSSIYADVIIPDTTYLERYVHNWHESPALKQLTGMRQPVLQDAVGRNLSLYNARSIRQILHEWARAIESDSLGTVAGGTDGETLTYNPKAPWGGGLFKDWNWDSNGELPVPSPSAGTSVGIFNGDVPASGTTLGVARGQEAEVAWHRCGWNGAYVPTISGSGFNYMRTNGFYEHPDGCTPNFWAGKDDAAQGGGGKHTTGYAGWIEIYHERLNALAELNASGAVSTTDTPSKDGSGKFFGTPVYVPIRKQGAFDTTDPANGKYNLTTYRLNVHTHARTASCPRLQEILGNSWAVMAPGSKDTAGNPINNGDKVRVTSSSFTVAADTTPVLRSLEIEAKITKRAQVGVVAISHSQGHDIFSFGGDGMGGVGVMVDTNNDGITDGKARWLDASGVIAGEKAASTVKSAAINAYRLNKLPSAPSTKYTASTKTTSQNGGRAHGSHPNWVINRGGEDPIGASVAYFDTMVTVTKI